MAYSITVSNSRKSQLTTRSSYIDIKLAAEIKCDNPIFNSVGHFVISVNHAIIVIDILNWIVLNNIWLTT
jgi:hypothetical protein